MVMGMEEGEQLKVPS